MRHAAAVLLVACLLGACSDEPPDVDWSRVPANQRTLIENAVRDGDCERMQAYFDGSENSDVLSYLDWHMKDAGCY